MTTLESFKALGKLKPHELARDSGALITLDTYEDLLEYAHRYPIVFFSHQWLSWAEPDPDRLQYREMIAACEQLCQRHGYTATQLHVFLDYISIPQRNMRLRLCAIDSLGVFASIAKHFVVVAPSAIHKDTMQVCDKASYARRGWYAAQ